MRRAGAMCVSSGVKRPWLWRWRGQWPWLLEPSLLVFLTVTMAVTMTWLPLPVLGRAQTYSVYTPIPVPASGFYHHHHPELGTYSSMPLMGSGGPRLDPSPRPSPSVLSTTSFFVPVPGHPGTMHMAQFSPTRTPAPGAPRPPRMPGPGPGAGPPGGPVPLAHHTRYHRPGQVLVPHARAPHARARPRQPGLPPPRPPPSQPRPSRLQVYRHSRKQHGSGMDAESLPTPKANWVPVHGASVHSTSTLRPPDGDSNSPISVSYISFDQYPSTSTSTSVSSSVSTSISKAKAPMPVPPPESNKSESGFRRTKTSTTTVAPDSTNFSTTTLPPMPVPAAAVVEGAEFVALNVNTSGSVGGKGNGNGKRRRKGKRRTTTTTTTPAPAPSPVPARLKETPEFQVPNPIYAYDYEGDGDFDTDYANNVLKRSPWSSTSSSTTEQTSSSSSSRRPTLLQRVELSDVTRIRAAQAAKNRAIAKASKSKSQQLWADRDRHTTTTTATRDDDEIKKVISTELRKTHLSSSQNRPYVTEAATEPSSVATPIWRVTRVETSMNYSDSMPGGGVGSGRGGVNELTVLPYDGGSQFESMYADRPTVNYVDLVTGESFNPFANSTPPFTQDLYNSDGKKERKQIQHQLLFNDDADLRQGSKLPENKTVDVDDTLSHLPREVPVEPDFKKTRLRLKKKHPLLNQDSIITAEQSVTKNGLEISTGGEEGEGHGHSRSPTTPMSTGGSKNTPPTTTSTTFRPYTTIRIIPTTRRPSLSSYTTEILNSWNSPTRTSTYATTAVATPGSRPTSTPVAQVTTRRNPATTPAFTTSTPATTTRRLSTRPTTTKETSTTSRRTTTTEATPTQPADNSGGLLDLFTLLGQTNTNSNDGSTTQANLFGFGQQQHQQPQTPQDLQSQLSLLESLLQGTQNLFGVPSTSTATSTSTTTTSTTTEHQPSSTSAATATLSDSEIKSFLDILGLSTSAPPLAPSNSDANSHSNGNPNNIQAVLDQEEPKPAAPTLSTQFVVPSAVPVPIHAGRPVQTPSTATPTPTAVPSLSAALSNMLAVLSNPFAPVTTTFAPPVQDNSLNNAALLAALLTPQNGNRNTNANGNGNGNANAGGQGDSLLTQLLQLGNALDPGISNSNTATRQVEATTPVSTTTTTPATRAPSLFDFSSLLGGRNGNAGGGLFGNAGAGAGNGNSWLNSLFTQPVAAPTSTTTSNPLAALLDLNRLLFPNGNGNNALGLGNRNTGLGGFGGLGNLFGVQNQPATSTANPFANLFNFNSLLTPAAPAATSPTPAIAAAANNQIEFHIPTTKRPSNPGPYVWLDVNTFFGGGAGPNDGLRPRIGSRDPFIRV